MEIERALQQLELLQKKLYAYHCADSSLYLDAVTTAPSDTSEGRGVAMSILAGESQKLMTCPETKALLDELSARAGELDLIHRREVEELRRSFRPEFLNRLDETIFFRPLTKDNLNGIIDIMLAQLRKRLADRSLGLEVTDKAKELIIDRGYDPVYGARPLRRYLQSSLETLVARKILSGDIDADSTITVDAENGELVCK